MRIKGFEYKCICHWSKDNKYGFIPNTTCKVHGKETREVLKKSIKQNVGEKKK